MLDEGLLSGQGVEGDNPALRYRPQATYPTLQGMSLIPWGSAHIGNQKGELGEAGKKQGPLPPGQPQFSGNSLANSPNSPTGRPLTVASKTSKVPVWLIWL